MQFGGAAGGPTDGMDGERQQRVVINAGLPIGWDAGKREGSGWVNDVNGWMCDGTGVSRARPRGEGASPVFGAAALQLGFALSSASRHWLPVSTELPCRLAGLLVAGAGARDPVSARLVAHGVSTAIVFACQWPPSLTLIEP